MMLQIPMPAIVGRAIGEIHILDLNIFINVFWNDECSAIIYKKGSEWFCSKDINTLKSISMLLNSASFNVGYFQLYEHGVVSSLIDDRQNFIDCMWSDYAHDGLFVKTELNLIPMNYVPGGEP
jgi:hypothetical protein